MASYASITELKLQIDKTGSTGTGDPANLQLLLDASTDAINSYTNHPDGFVALSVATAREMLQDNTAQIITPDEIWLS